MKLQENNVTLTSVTKADAKPIYDLFMEDKEKIKDVFTFVTDDMTLENQEKFFSNPGENYPFIIKYNEKTCGYALLYDQEKENNSISILYYVNSKYNGKGIATSAVEQLLEYAFKDLEVDKVYFYINTDNEASIKLAERLGIEYEKLLPKYDFCNGKYHDQKLYSIRKNEYIKNNNKAR